MGVTSHDASNAGLPKVSLAGTVLSIRFARPPVNAFNNAVRAALAQAIDLAVENPRISGVLFSAEGRCFAAGADIGELRGGIVPPFLGDMLRRLETSGKPAVAALQGDALGGGMELALACTYRIAVAEARVGLPEIRLGLIPGAGGTQRLTRLVGKDRALAMLSRGTILTATDAYSVGLVDEVLPAPRLEQRARELLRGMPPQNPPEQAMAPEAMETGGAGPEFEPTVEALACLKAAVEAALNHDVEAGFAVERELIRQLLASPEVQQRLQDFVERRK